MPAREPSAIVLATTDQPREMAAIRFAAVEAAASGSAIHVVHVVHGSTAEPGRPLLYSYAQLDERAAQTCAQVAERLRNLTSGSVAITTEAPRGRTIEQLMARSANARMVVLQGRGRSRAEHPLTPSTTEALASRAPSLVVSVPMAWHPYPPLVRRIVVGTGRGAGPTRLLDEALRLAGEHNVPVLVLHAMDQPVAGREADEEQKHRRPLAREELEHAVQTLRRRHPDVPVTVEIGVGRPPDVLREATDAHDLLVIGRRDADHPVYEHLGSVAQEVVRSTQVPVTVVPRPMDAPVLRLPVSANQPIT